MQHPGSTPYGDLANVQNPRHRHFLPSPLPSPLSYQRSAPVSVWEAAWGQGIAVVGVQRCSHSKWERIPTTWLLWDGRHLGGWIKPWLRRLWLWPNPSRQHQIEEEESKTMSKPGVLVDLLPRRQGQNRQHGNTWHIRLQLGLRPPWAYTMTYFEGKENNNTMSLNK
jgi:hypothetical protein